MINDSHPSQRDVAPHILAFTRYIVCGFINQIHFIFRNSQLTEKFREQFPGSCLHGALADFSLPSSLSDKCHPMNFDKQQVNVQFFFFLIVNSFMIRMLIQNILALLFSNDL